MSSSSGIKGSDGLPVQFPVKSVDQRLQALVGFNFSHRLLLSLPGGTRRRMPVFRQQAHRAL